MITKIEADKIEESQENYANLTRTIVFEKEGRQELFEKWLSQT